MTDVIGTEQVAKATALLQRYKTGKAALDKRIVDNELWFRMQHWANYQNEMMEGKPITITDPNMTRFMMTLDDAVDLVVYAFQHGHNGDLFVQKAPAATLETLATALKQIYAKVDPKYGETEVKVIGTRHGEKLYETLVTREEMAKAIDMGNYYRIPCDTRDLNYDKFFTEGSEDLSRIEDYHSHNTRRLDVEGMKEQLLRLRFIQEDLGMVERAKPRDIRSE